MNRIDGRGAAGAKKMLSPDLEAQIDYAERVEAEGFDFGVTVAEAFLRGMRSIGYRSSATALDELVDNAVQAEARNVHVIFDYEKNDVKKEQPMRIGVLDDGHGMTGTMIRLSMIWGGTHRENDRSGFGRFGYGLPSSALSQGKSFSVYSMIQGGALMSVTFDLARLENGGYRDSTGRTVMPEAEPAMLPAWVRSYLKETPGAKTFTQGTLVVLERLDQLTWKTTTDLKRHLLAHFGIVYRNTLRRANIYVQGERAEACDPLFITPGCRYFDYDEDRAIALEESHLQVSDRETGKSGGIIRVRYAFMPPTFTKEDKLKGRGKSNPRLEIMKEHNGIIVLRNGRQIDVVTRCPWTTFQNNDRYWGVEVNFPASLDEEIGITTAKQQIELSPRIWTILENGGVWAAIKQLRKMYRQAKAKTTAQEDKKGAKRASERAMEAAAKFRMVQPGIDTVERRRKAEERFEAEVARRATTWNLELDVARQQFMVEITHQPYKVIEETSPGGPFYRVEQIGGQRVLTLNSAHRFYTDVFAGPGSSSRIRSGIEILLFVLGEAELDANDDDLLWYERERGLWSQNLNTALDRLDQIDSVEDAMALAEEEAESEGGD